MSVCLIWRRAVINLHGILRTTIFSTFLTRLQTLNIVPDAFSLANSVAMVNHRVSSFMTIDSFRSDILRNRSLARRVAWHGHGRELHSHSRSRFVSILQTEK
jgi:hypothetical protein